MNDYFDSKLVDDLEDLAEEADARGDYEAANEALMKIEAIANEARSKALKIPKSSADIPTGFESRFPVSQAQAKPQTQTAMEGLPVIGSAISTGKDVAQTGAAMLSGIGSDVLGRTMALAGGGYPADPEKQSQIYEQVTAQNQYVPTRQGAQQNLQAISEALQPLESLPPVVGAGMPQMNAIARSASLRPELPQDVTPSAEMQQALDINRGSERKDLAGKMTTAQAPMKPVTDPIAKQAMSLGASENLVQTAKSLSAADKKKASQMLDIIGRSDDELTYGKFNRPSDVLGDSMADRVEPLKDLNRKAGAEVNKAVKSLGLKNEPVNYEPIFDDFASKLDEELKIKLDDNGVPIYKKSRIQDRAPDEALIGQVVGRMRLTKDAEDLHELKKYIYDMVDYGEKKEGKLNYATKNLMKGFAADINKVLGDNYPEYAAANQKYSDTIDALNDIEKAMGNVNVYSESRGAIGSKMRQLLSDAGNRQKLEVSINKVEDIAKKYGIKFDDDLKSQVAIADELESLFKVKAPKGFQSEINKAGEAVKSARQKGATETVIDFAFEPLVKPFRKSEDQKRKETLAALKKLMARGEK